MKKITAALVIMAALLTTACTNDAIEIEYDVRHDCTLHINTEKLYDDFNIKNGIMTQLLSSKSNYQVAIITLAYDQQGTLTDSAATYLKTFSQVQQKLSVSRGAATIITIETLVNPADDYQSEAWEIKDADKLSTLAIKARRSHAYWYEAVGISTQTVNASGDQQLTITPNPVGSIVVTKFYNLDQTDNDYAAIYTHNRPVGFRIDPSLNASDHYIYDQYNEQTTWSRRGFKSNKGGHLENNIGFDAYILESGNINWCITATKMADDGSIKFTAYPNRESYFNFENGKKYYAGLYYTGSSYQAFLGNYDDYSSWYNLVSSNVPAVKTLYREPCTTWGATVATVKSYMNGYTLYNDIDYDESFQKYYINYYGADEETYIEYYFTTRTSGLTDSYVFVPNTLDITDVMAQVISQGYKFYKYDSDDDFYIYTKGTTSVMIYTGNSYHVVNYYDQTQYTTSVKASAPRRRL